MPRALARAPGCVRLWPRGSRRNSSLPTRQKKQGLRSRYRLGATGYIESAGKLRTTGVVEAPTPGIVLPPECDCVH
jgi:hypothetical protein